MQTAKIDPNVSIPPAVRKLAERADAAFREAHGVPAEPPAAAAPPAEPEPPVPQDNVAPVTPTGNATEPPPAANDNWEHKYNSMKGRFERSQNDIRAMSDQIAQLQSLMATMNSAPAPTPNELRAESLLTPEEVQEYGPEFLGVVAKKAKEELTPEVAALQRKLASLESRLEGAQANTSANARRVLEATLDDKVPMWRDVNVAPEFHQWLALPDLFSGAIRHSLLKAAYEQNDTPRVLAFFKGFLADEAASAPALNEPAPADDTSGKIPLETFAAPGRAKTAAASGAPAEKPTFTRTQIAKFYADSAAGKYRGKEAEKNRIEAQIFEAEREGRIR